MEVIAAAVCLNLFFVFLLFRRPIISSAPKYGILGYRQVYSDLRGKKRGQELSCKLLRSEKYSLSGKPDIIYKHCIFNRYIPVELKSGSVNGSKSPHHGDLLQLAAYFALVESEYGKKPKQGRLIYKDAMFTVRNTAKLRKEMVSTLAFMRSMLEGKDLPCEPSFQKCRHCMCRGTVCEYCGK